VTSSQGTHCQQRCGGQYILSDRLAVSEMRNRPVRLSDSSEARNGRGRSHYLSPVVHRVKLPMPALRSAIVYETSNPRGMALSTNGSFSGFRENGWVDATAAGTSLPTVRRRPWNILYIVPRRGALSVYPCCPRLLSIHRHLWSTAPQARNAPDGHHRVKDYGRPHSHTVQPVPSR
jgi:hypothetical protein